MADTGEGPLFDIMWDIILSFYVLSGAAHYFAWTFCCSLPLAGSSLLLSYPMFNLTPLQIRGIIICLGIGMLIRCAQHSVRVYKVPKHIGYRLSIGLLASVFLLIGEMLVWPALYWRWSIWNEFYEQSDKVTISLFGTMTVLVAMMPSLLMLMEEAETSRQVKAWCIYIPIAIATRLDITTRTICDLILCDTANSNMAVVNTIFLYFISRIMKS